MEKKLSNEIMLLCGQNDIIVFDVNVGKVKTVYGTYFDSGLPKGFPDLFLLHNDGRAIFIEVKVKPNKPSADQRDFIKFLRERGFFADVVFSISDMKHLINTGFTSYLYTL